MTRSLCLCFLCWFVSLTLAEPPDPSVLRRSVWAAPGMTQDPVALSFDRQGRLYLVESARRSTVDIDIRAHRSWLLDDLANDDFASMRDFFLRQMAPERSQENAAWLQDRNQDGSHDYRDLTTISERIRLLEDTNGDGQADRSTVYAADFKEPYTGVAAGVMPYDGDVLMTVYPDLWRLRDLDGDGRADGRVSLFRGFGVHAAFDGHDLHGLTVGPEGKIYFSCGDNGFSVTTREGRRLHHPNTGGVLRMNPDGSQLEVFATGLRNVQEFDFDQYGNMFGVDNDGDLEDERERAVYIAEGSDSGWRLNWQFRSPGWAKYNGNMTYNPWTAEGMWKPAHPDQPAYITPPMQNYSVGPGGFKFNPGTALNEAYRNFFFCVQFPVQKITAFRTQPQGAGFAMQDEHLFHGGLMVSSLNFGPDGGLYLADWVGKWEPNGEGVVYKIDDPERAGSAEREEVQHLLRSGVARESTETLSQLLGHADRRVRQLAQFELVRRGSISQLQSIANSASAPQLGRIHALWGILQLGRPAKPQALSDSLPWDDADPQIRQQCARVAGDLRLRPAAPALTQQLTDSAPLVVSHAAIALGKVASPEAFDPLIDLLDRQGEQDPFLRHAAVMGLAGTATADRLADLHGHPSSAVRMGAVLALRRQQHAAVRAFLHDTDLRVQREAVRAIHDDFSIPAALPDVARLLGQPLPPDEPLLRRVLSANLRVGTQDAAERLGEFLLRPAALGSLTLPLQLEALACLAAWNQAPLVDRVEGRVRNSVRADAHAGQKTLATNLEALFLLGRPEITQALTALADSHDLRIPTERLRNWVLDSEQPAAVRVTALRALASQEQDLDAFLEARLPEVWQAGAALPETALAILVERAPERALQHIDLSAPLPAQRFLIEQLGRLALPEARAKLDALLRDVVAGSAARARVLDIVAAARDAKSDSFETLLHSFAAGAKQHPWGEFQFAAEGGDPTRGATLYREHVSAQCIRCHDAGGPGKQAGPVLAGVGTRLSRDQLLEALVAPSQTIAKGFSTISLVLEDGRVLQGTLIVETNEEIVLGTTDGKQHRVAKAEVEERIAQAQSAMPDMRQVLTPREVRDVVAYLATLRAP